MKYLRTSFVLASIASVASLPSPASAAGKLAPASRFYAGPFQATLYRGPDTGAVFAGDLRLRVNRQSGAASGSLLRARGRPFGVNGQVQGASISLFIDLGGGKHLFAVGVIGHTGGGKKEFIGGPVVGPGRGDGGDWNAYLVPHLGG